MVLCAANYQGGHLSGKSLRRFVSANQVLSAVAGLYIVVATAFVWEWVAARANQQHRALMSGDIDAGVYGSFQPPRLSRRDVPEPDPDPSGGADVAAGVAA